VNTPRSALIDAYLNSTNHNTQKSNPDWHVLVLYTDDTEHDVKGIWGPYTSLTIANSALDELKQWPLDGYWDVRRLNKFVAAKAGTPADSLMKWTWQTSA
jgi:hypothetical protein